MSDKDAWQKPAWTGETGEPEAALARMFGVRNREAYEEQLAALRDSEASTLRMIDEYTRYLRNTQQRLGQTRATLRELEDSPPPILDLDQATRELMFMRRLPGVMGMRVDEYERPVVHVRTGMVHRRRHYDFGDFEIALGPRHVPDPDYGLEPTLDVTCTRAGVKQYRDSYGDMSYYEALYWHPEDHYRSGGLGAGWFCFGVRADQINETLRQGRYGETLHIVIATMCSVNKGDQGNLSELFKSTKLTRKDRKAHRQGQALSMGIPEIQ